MTFSDVVELFCIEDTNLIIPQDRLRLSANQRAIFHAQWYTVY